MIGKKRAIAKKDNQGIISNYALEGYRTIHNKEKNRSESEGRRKVISQTGESYEIDREGKDNEVGMCNNDGYAR